MNSCEILIANQCFIMVIKINGLSTYCCMSAYVACGVQGVEGTGT